MYRTVPRASSKSAIPIEFVDVSVHLDSVERILSNRLIGCLFVECDRQEAVESLSAVREVAQRIAAVWPEQRSRCSRAIAAIDRVLTQFADRQKGVDAVEMVAAGEVVFS